MSHLIGQLALASESGLGATANIAKLVHCPVVVLGRSRCEGRARGGSASTDFYYFIMRPGGRGTTFMQQHDGFNYFTAGPGLAVANWYRVRTSWFAFSLFFFFCFGHTHPTCGLDGLASLD